MQICGHHGQRTEGQKQSEDLVNNSHLLVELLYEGPALG